MTTTLRHGDRSQAVRILQTNLNNHSAKLNADGSYGDLLVTVAVQVPQHLSADAKSALEAYEAASGAGDPRASLFAS